VRLRAPATPAFFLRARCVESLSKRLSSALPEDKLDLHGSVLSCTALYHDDAVQPRGLGGSPQWLCICTPRGSRRGGG
jgi:hypothetical protein